jgi:tRNA U54 and U55 pseudouridine synthase Pus10
MFKAGEEFKKKNYRCVVWASRPVTDDDLAKLSAINEMVVDQTTPVRVLHRYVMRMILNQ